MNIAWTWTKGNTKDQHVKLRLTVGLQIWKSCSLLTTRLSMENALEVKPGRKMDFQSKNMVALDA